MRWTEEELSVKGMRVTVKETMQVFEAETRPIATGESSALWVEEGELSRIRLAWSPGDGGYDYRVLEEVGRGGTAVVFRAQEAFTGRHVALKVSREGEKAQWAKNRILREAAVASCAGHPNMVPVYRVGRTADGRVVLAMKLVDGKPWSEVLAQRDEIGEEGALQVVIAACRALEFCHARGILHLDINPSNILVGDYGEVYVGDWGIARSTTALPGIPSAERFYDVEGTPSYMPPEMAMPGDAEVSEATDVYLLGASLYEALTGERPHRGRARQEPEDWSVQRAGLRLPPGYGDVLTRIVETATDPDPNARFPSVASFRSALEGYRQHAAARALVDDASEVFGRIRCLESSLDASVPTLATEVLLAVRMSLRLWPDNPAAHALVDELAEMMFKFELGRGHPDSASEWVDQMEPARAMAARRTIRVAVAREQEERRERAERAQAMQEREVSRGLRARERATRFHWVLFAGPIVILAAAHLAGYGVANYTVGGLMSAALFVSSVCGLFAPKGFEVNDINRRWSLMNMILAMAAGSSFVVGAAAALPFLFALGLSLLFASATLAGAMVLLDYRGLAAPSSLFIAGLVVALAPSIAGYVLPAGVCVCLFVLRNTWQRIGRVQAGVRRLHESA